MTDYSNSEFFVSAVKSVIENGESITIDGDGDSMRPFINPETDRITLSAPPKKLRTGNVCLYLRLTKPVIHRIYKCKNGAYDMLGDNQLRIERNVPSESIIAVVENRIRGGEVLNCLENGYRIRAVIKMKSRVLKYNIKAAVGEFYGKIKAHLR